MATDTPTRKSQANTEQALITTPIVLTRSKPKRRRKRYSKGTKGLQRFLLGLSDATYRVTNSFTKGFDTFNDRSKRSRWKRRDGMVRDFFRNASRGFSDGIDQFGKAPDELARRISTRRVARSFRTLTPFAR